MTSTHLPQFEAASPENPSERLPRHRIGVLGASGTTGAELVRLLMDHPAAQVAFATSRTHAGRALDEIEPWAPPVRLIHPDEADPDATDAVLLCLPHGSSGPAAAELLERGCRVIDVSGDHRLRDADAHARVYASDRDEAAAGQAVYGLTELVRNDLAEARLVANPGCYATAALLALAPLARAGLLRAPAVIDAKSGVSGAGRTPTDTTHFCSASGDVRPYRPGRAHRHVAEIEQMLDARVVFTPHLVPLERGIEATIVLGEVPGGEPAVREALHAAYDGEAFVRLLPPGRLSRIRS
ncbi:MAG TPA: N-acetyl-gamma-glutamyl-phosphate reductase, partial [bacterium]|nr:N-acetyl-gamma-glutamyl-phosphate reductase [bacterium]